MWRDQESLILYLSMWYISSNIVVPFMLGVNIIWTRAGRSPANNLHSRFPYRLVLKLMPQDDIYWIIDQVSQQLSSHAEHYSTAEPSVTITHDTHYTHSVAVLNLSWQHSGKLLVFLPIFAFLNLNCPLRNTRDRPVSRLPFWIPARQCLQGVPPTFSYNRY